MNGIHCFRYVFAVFLFIFFGVLTCPALEKEHVVVIANGNLKESVDLADYYMKRRGISKQQRIVLKTVTTETCCREDYEKDIAGPVRAYLMKRNPEPNETCLVLMYGIPLKIDGSQHGTDENKGLNYDSRASVDSELTMVCQPGYPLSGWIENPLCRENRKKSMFADGKNVFCVSRLDGPTPFIVKRMVDDSIETEKTGLRGSAFFDARWPKENTQKINAYTRFDKTIHAAAQQVTERRILSCKLESTPNLFQKDDCPDAAIYCGWYSLGRYVDAFAWVKGAVAYHVASSECTTLKNTGSRVWCKVMLEKGVAATLGPVGEPYLQSFPRPDIFFGYLFDGNCLAESYIKSTPCLSWKMVLIGDPLYRPF